MNKFLPPFVILLAAILSGCFGDNYEWYQKLTIVVETPEGIKTGSSVTKAEWSRNHFFKDAGPYFSSATGEAAFVELGEGRYLFVTMGNFYPSIAVKLFAGSYPPPVSMRDAYKLIKSSGAKEIPPEDYWLLVTFEDIDEPSSVKEVSIENFHSIFGRDYKLKSIVLEYVDEDEVSNNIESVLKWWREYAYAIDGKYGKRLSGKHGPRVRGEGFADSVGPGSFKIKGK